jgi:acyl carrier protein
MNEKIRYIMANAFEVPAEEINENSSHDDVENWDSIHHASLIAMLEREFDIVIPEEDIVNMINFKLIKLIINEQISI